MGKLLKQKEVIAVGIILVMIISLSILYNLKDSYSASLGNTMWYFPSTITSHKEEIIEVYFISDTQANIDSRYNQASIKADLSKSGNVKGNYMLQV